MKIIRPIPALVLFVVGSLLAGCASMSSNVAPGVNLANIKKIHVVKLPADQRGIERIIADELNVMGYPTTIGSLQDVPDDADAILTYQDKWMWDITMYMLELNVQLREPKTEIVMASATSYRPSLERKSPKEMAKEVLTEIFKKR